MILKQIKGEEEIGQLKGGRHSHEKIPLRKFYNKNKTQDKGSESVILHSKKLKAFYLFFPLILSLLYKDWDVLCWIMLCIRIVNNVTFEIKISILQQYEREMKLSALLFSYPIRLMDVHITSLSYWIYL